MIKCRWKRNTAPPALPSDLIALALKDLSWVEEHNEYDINMIVWAENCAVCFAGAVMVRRFKIPDECCPTDFDSAWESAFYALDSFRMGCVSDGLNYLGFKRQFKEMRICSYHQNHIHFKQDMNNLITFLQRNGL